MFVVKRNGTLEEVDFAKIHKRINWLIKEPFLLENVNGAELTQKVIQGIKNEMKTSEIDIYTAELSSSLGTKHLNYIQLAGRIAVNNHHKNTLKSFRDKMNRLYIRIDNNGKNSPVINQQFYKYVEKNHSDIDKYIDYGRDYLIDFFGFKTLQKGYLLSINGEIIERPQDLWMRVAIQIGMPKDPSLYKNKSYLDKIFHIYDRMSKQYYTHATPTLFNSGMVKPQMSSCFLLKSEDSLEGIMKTLTDCVQISKWSGGIGFDLTPWRSENSLINGTNGRSSGIVPFLRMFNDGARAFNQGGKRKGSFAAYLEMHHPDLMNFLSLRLAQGDENLRCRDLFLALWIPDLFMKRLEKGEDWSLFDPNECPGLHDVFGDEYEKLYLEYEAKGMAKKKLNIYDIMEAVCNSQMEGGNPYTLFKDTINRSSMQKNIGPIYSSNLCVTGDTLILTDKGYYTIEELVNVENPIHKVWNGEKWSEAVFSQTGEEKKILEIETTQGNIIKCTPYHKFIMVRGSEYDKEELVNAAELEIGDCLVKFQYPIVDYGKDFPYAYYRGFFCGNGVIDKNETLTNNHVFDICEKFVVPINFSLKSKLEWLAGLFDAGDTLSKNETDLVLELMSVNKEFLQNVKLLCNTLGTNPIISSMREEVLPDMLSEVLPDMLPDNKEMYKLSFNNMDTYKLYELDLPTKRIKYNGHIPDTDMTLFNKIKSITVLETLENTYCFNESLKHRGVFNGMLLGNCSEITLVTDPDHISVCNLASICLGKFVEDTYSLEELELPEESRRKLNHTFPKNPIFNYKLLATIAGELTENINNVIDKNWNPTVEGARTNFKNRPIGIGIQGLADVFMKFKCPFESEGAKILNKRIAESIYFGALSKSTELCRQFYMDTVENMNNILNGEGEKNGENKENGEIKKYLYPENILQQFPVLKEENIVQVFTSVESIPLDVGAYHTYHMGEGAPIQSKFHWEIHGLSESDLSGLFDWRGLREHINIYGVRNSTLVAYMPTSSTSQIMGGIPSFEPYHSAIYRRKTLAGHFVVFNKYLMNDLMSAGLWNEQIKSYLLMHEGSIQNLEGVPENMKNLYKTIWDIKQSSLMELAADRQPFVDQSQSMNLYFKDYNLNLCISALLHGWKLGLKTGSYYLNVPPAVEAQKFTVSDYNTNDIANIDFSNIGATNNLFTIDDPDEEDKLCLLCGS